MCLANGLTDAFALEARPSSATYNPVSAAAWNAAAAARANKTGEMSIEDMAELSDSKRSEAEARLLGAKAMALTPGTIFLDIYGTMKRNDQCVLSQSGKFVYSDDAQRALCRIYNTE